MKLNYRPLTIVCLALGALLRIGLWWANPLVNSFDDHFEPILMIMRTGAVPAKDACWQCYHPPVFYWISAKVGSVAGGLGLGGVPLLKLLQFLPCLYGILTLAVLHGILEKLPLGSFARLTALAVVCFLPRHIYMSAMNSNDTISYLFVALCIYLLLSALERRLAVLQLLAAGAVTTVALFTKYTALAVLPAYFVVFAELFWKRLLASRRRIAVSFGLAMLPPLLVFGVSLVTNTQRYGSPLPWNVSLEDPSRTQPHDRARMDFFSFKPWESMATPILVPGKIHSFWTLTYTGTWFDNEPKFLYFLDSDARWWKHYYAWLRGKEPFPGENPAMRRGTRATGSVLIGLGLGPLGLVAYGICRCLQQSWRAWVGGSPSDQLTAVRWSVFPVLLLGNAVIAVALAVRLPVYSAAKASYWLGSLPAFAVFFGLGVMGLGEQPAWKWTVGVACGVFCGLAGAHIVQIVHALLVSA